MALWLDRAGEIVDSTDLPEPFVREIAGDGGAAAAFWSESGSPLAAARALGASGAEADMRASLAALDALGASADVARVTRQLREMGARHIPRGPRPATRSNAGGLTTRELEVLGLLARGCTNRDIAHRLYLSPKTAGHHVSAILAKLDVASRHDAVAHARALGLLQDGEPDQPNW
jgi:DNA-binding NarL/FixJ family response regulator